MSKNNNPSKGSYPFLVGTVTKLQKQIVLQQQQMGFLYQQLLLLQAKFREQFPEAEPVSPNQLELPLENPNGNQNQEEALLPAEEPELQDNN